MSKVILFDIGYVMHRAIFAYRHNTAVPCTFTFLRMLIGYLKKIGFEQDDLIIAAQDYGSWRKEIDKAYKAQRKEFRESKEDPKWWEERYNEFNSLIPKLDESLPWHWCKSYKIEADDWASVACRYYSDREIILVSSDKDWEMLCHYSNVKIFSPLSKKYKIVKDPMKVLMEKIHGDISDNLISVPSSEYEFDIRKKIVDLINPLPEIIENTIKDKFASFLPKNLYVHKIPFRTIAQEIKKIYRA